LKKVLMTGKKIMADTRKKLGNIQKYAIFSCLVIFPVLTILTFHPSHYK
jgi:hypothetical protein